MEKQHNSPTWQCFQGYLPQSQWGHDNLSQYRGVIYGFIPSSSPLLFHDILTIFQLSSHHYQHYCWWNHHEITINELITIKSHEILVNHHESTIKSPWLSHFLQTAPSSNGAPFDGSIFGSWQLSRMRRRRWEPQGSCTVHPPAPGQSHGWMNSMASWLLCWKL
jgi:hypothetical protein